ncbi:Bacterial type II secretion system protein F domain protein [Aquisphaera giovannonii]|uniref:Bacterial type II secretion system protein F domain protein n=1 Tax=Aquisphaera giovannonii TaxID=406548 RepID=A0A5B9W0X9_9BACT|nr:type II secretion system F family protein [Aquisphaera giovannonii]QEH34302.1 Bacterial type II secretion system protein F domain protein [Aquisphaera giovannonii]
MLQDPIVLSILVGVGVIVLVAGLGLVMTGSFDKLAEERLEGLTGAGTKRGREALSSGILLRPAAINLGGGSVWARLIPNPDNLNLLYEQADVNLTFNSFMAMVLGLAALGAVVGVFLQVPVMAIPAASAFLAALPFLWLLKRKQKRIRKFVEAMPEAVELISRALRAGHGLASGLHLVAEEMRGPLADEFNRVFEEQNFGVPIEISLRNMADRIPVMDVRFFVIAIIIQRATGGDLAEVLDKIGRLIRQRFELLGHVKALTAEGRLSGIVLLALPPALLAFLSFSNYPYISPLFTTAIGTKMLVVTAVFQVVGAWMINKIVAIKV